MNGGVIENNTNYRGGGVHVTGKEYTYRASMEMNGGIIRNNTCNGFQSAKNYASGGGGGIYISGNAQVVMNDGKIVGNTVNGGPGRRRLHNRRLLQYVLRRTEFAGRMAD